jgi:hypothetical protein
MLRKFYRNIFQVIKVYRCAIMTLEVGCRATMALGGLLCRRGSEAGDFWCQGRKARGEEFSSAPIFAFFANFYSIFSALTTGRGE